ncbi:Gfo/Idh/MocA family protein [Microbacterium sp. bgisy189]|uniref:Gfo/Idh/MocA family protein n=1 Tax=Microbacterium sp. bgisy189 TaxID=3413798 RepID=UPI003EBA6753
MHGVGIVGVWHVHVADYVGEILERDDAKIIGVWDADAAAAARFAEPLGLPVVPDLETLLLDDRVDVIVVDTATSEHVEIISRALEAGKHVFTEKVLAISTDDAIHLETLAERCDRVLQVSFQRLSEPWVPTMGAIIDAGILGTLTSSRIRYQHAGAVEGWLPSGFFSPSEAGGGAVIDLGVHGLYLSQLLHGSYPETVTCRTSDLAGVGVEDNAVVILEYAGGAFSVLETSLSSAPNDARWVEVHGTRGTAMVDSRDGGVYVKTGAEDWVRHRMREPKESPLSHFFAAIDDGAGYEWNRSESIRLVSLVSAAYDSERERSTVGVIDPVPR